MCMVVCSYIHATLQHTSRPMHVWAYVIMHFPVWYAIQRWRKTFDFGMAVAPENEAYIT